MCLRTHASGSGGWGPECPVLFYAALRIDVSRAGTDGVLERPLRSTSQWLRDVFVTTVNVTAV